MPFSLYTVPLAGSVIIPDATVIDAEGNTVTKKEGYWLAVSLQPDCEFVFVADHEQHVVVIDFSKSL
jgi:hypothetical protein